MLVLSRKESERIRIGESIVITVVRVARDRVRLGIEAPDDVLVLRDELEKEQRDVEVPSASAEPVKSRAAAERRTLADFRRGRVSTRPSAEDSTEADEDAIREVAVAEEEDAKAENRGASPMRRFFRW